MRRTTQKADRASRRFPRGFTLIELLVVVAIIALLISILLPSLTKAREQAKMVLCRANFRTLGNGVNYFKEDYKEYYPESQRWLGFPSWWESHLTADQFTSPRGNPGVGLKESWLLKYVKDENVYNCPSDNGTRAYKAPVTGDLYSMPVGTTNYTMQKSIEGLAQNLYWTRNRLGYFPDGSGRMNGKFSLDYSPDDPMSRVTIRTSDLFQPPGRVMLMMEESELSPLNDGSVGWSGAHVTQADQVTQRHSKRGHLMMFDGHIESIRSYEEYNALTPRADFKCALWNDRIYYNKSDGQYHIRRVLRKTGTDAVW